MAKWSVALSLGANRRILLCDRIYRPVLCIAPSGSQAGNGERPMQVKWSDIEHSDNPGEYTINDKVIRVQKSDVDFWKEQPNAVFDIMDARFSDGGIGHVLVLANEDEQPSRSESAS